jgi:hypothetical protein
MSEVYETQKLGLLKRPWVALQGWTCEPAARKDAECEHGEGDQRLGGMETSGLPYLRDSAGADPVRLLALESPAENWGLRRPMLSLTGRSPPIWAWRSWPWAARSKTPTQPATKRPVS